MHFAIKQILCKLLLFAELIRIFNLIISILMIMNKIVIIPATILLLFSCMTVKKNQPLPVNHSVLVQRMDKNVNSGGDDYSPCLLPDGSNFLFVSDRFGSKINFEAHKSSHDIWYAIKQNFDDSLYQVVSISDSSRNFGLNTNFNEGGMCFSSDFTKMYFTGCNRNDGFGDCDIYEADIIVLNNQIFVSNIMNLGPVINTNFWETLPSISPDNKTLYFVSNRNSSSKSKTISVEADGITIRRNTNDEIYFSIYDEKESQWSSPKPLPKTINSDKKEFSPKMCSDNKTLIFSSKGREPNGGGYDLFYSKLDSNGNWSNPVNFGAPMNSEYDDAFLTLSSDGESGYFSSNRNNRNSNYDIYRINMLSILDDVRIISWKQDSTADVLIVINDESGDQVHAIEYKSIKEGRYTLDWDGKDVNGIDFKPGKYTYQVFVGENAPGLPRLLWIKPKH